MHGNLFLNNVLAYMLLLQPYTLIYFGPQIQIFCKKIITFEIFYSFWKFWGKKIVSQYHQSTLGWFFYLGWSTNLRKTYFFVSLHANCSPTRLSNWGLLSVYTAIRAYTLIRTFRVLWIYFFPFRYCGIKNIPENKEEGKCISILECLWKQFCQAFNFQNNLKTSKNIVVRDKTLSSRV